MRRWTEKFLWDSSDLNSRHQTVHRRPGGGSVVHSPILLEDSFEGRRRWGMACFARRRRMNLPWLEIMHGRDQRIQTHHIRRVGRLRSFTNTIFGNVGLMRRCTNAPQEIDAACQDMGACFPSKDRGRNLNSIHQPAFPCKLRNKRLIRETMAEELEDLQPGKGFICYRALRRAASVCI
jgi:hypothetical protein